MKKPRSIRIEGEIAYVPLTKGYEAIIDAADAPLVSGVCWTAHVDRRTVYACRRLPRTNGGRQKSISMHRLLLNCPDDLVVDHVNGNGLDNRRCNLRAISSAQNTMNQRISCDNTSGFKGVGRSKCGKSWRARIRVAGELISLGTFQTREEAHAKYAEAISKYHGEYGRLS